jgi:hypothetical protein
LTVTKHFEVADKGATSLPLKDQKCLLKWCKCMFEKNTSKGKVAWYLLETLRVEV